MLPRHYQGKRHSPRRDVILFALENRYSMAPFPSMLHRTGCRVTVLGESKSCISTSRFVERIIPCSSDPTLAAQALRDLVGTYRDRLPWIIFADEPALQAGILCRDQPWLKDAYPVDPWRSADLIFRKSAFMIAAQAGGIPIPPTRICGSRDEALAAGQTLSLPLFLKRDVDCGGAGVVKVLHMDDVGSAYDKLADTGSVVVQQMVPGRLGKTNTFFSRGRLMCHTSSFAKRTWPAPFGASCIREYFCDDRLERIASGIGAVTAFNGFCGFDWIQDENTGEFAVIEFNGQAVSAYHLGKYVGVSYERAVADFLDGRFSTQRPRLTSTSRPIIHLFPQDIRRCITELDMIGLGNWLVGAVTTDTPWGDANIILFFLFDFVRLGYRRARNLIRRLLGEPAHT
jgi:predicted ATP-grasp superfamily ATP-dependent carboligase